MSTIIPIRLPICNAFIVRDVGTVLVDTGRPRDAPAILRALHKENIKPGDLSLIVHTHGHWDHAGGTREIQAAMRAPAAIHRADAAKLRSGDGGPLKPATLGGRLLLPFATHRFPSVEPQVIFAGTTDLNAYGIDAQVVPTPGHTAGSMALVTSAGEVLVGDLVMGGFLGGRVFPRRPNYHYFAEDLAQLRASLRELLSLPVTTVYPGHGGPLDPARLKHWLEMQ